MPGSSCRAVATKRFQEDLQGLDAKIQDRILSAVSTKLAPDPFRAGRKLRDVKAGKSQWKFRIGDYRVRFDIEGTDIALHRVAHRREIYR